MFFSGGKLRGDLGGEGICVCVVVGEVEGWETVVGAYCMREESICNKTTTSRTIITESLLTRDWNFEQFWVLLKIPRPLETGLNKVCFMR